MLRHDPKFDVIIRGIVMTRGENGATIEEMRKDYFAMFCEVWPLKSQRTEDVIAYLMGISGLMMEKRDSGLCIWYIDDIGSNISERHTDSNNNVNEASQSDASGRQIEPSTDSANTATSLSSSSLSTSAILTSAASTEALDSIELDENERAPAAVKRKMSQDTSIVIEEKRLKLTAADRLPLIEKNLDIHNRNSGASGVLKQVATSTEKENSMLAANGAATSGIDAIECIEVIEAVADIEYHETIDSANLKKLQKMFPEQCRIDDKSTNAESDPTTSSGSLYDEVLPPGFALVGDDFMRSVISHELFGGDFTDKYDKHYSYCFSGQTVRKAYHMVLDKQCTFRANYANIIVNVGAIDILLGRNLIDIQADYARLVKSISTIGCQPILTTIPELRISPDLHHNEKIVRQMVLLFNRFLNDFHADGYPLVDLHSRLSKKTGARSNHDYHQQPKLILVDNQEVELRLWDSNGRKKVLDALHESLF